jgi:hypothetical protein
MNLNWRCRPACGLLVLMAVLLVGVGLGRTPRAGPVCGVHTIWADDKALALIHETGCSWVVQLFNWSEIEPLPGEYFWEYPDAVARACQYYRLNLAVRLDHQPTWASSSQGHGLPVDVDAYAAFVARVAERYQGRVQAYIIWNEPNLAQEWGGQAPDPAAYVELLELAYGAVKKSDPGALVVSAGLAPTNHMDETAMDDRIYLQGMYEAGAAEAFDILGAHPYGFAYPPLDARHAHEGLNFARLLDLRDTMLRNGDADKPVWATEVGWTTEVMDEEQAWLQVNEEQQAAYLTGAFERARVEWPWLEMIGVWNLSAGLQADDEKRGYSIVNDVYDPRPAYLALAAMPKRRLLGQRALARPDNGAIEILAKDVVIRLGDADTFHPHWARIYGGQAPCRRWSGEFYMDRLGTPAWQLTMEIMQVEEQGNLVTINGHTLKPTTVPLRGKLDFASSWTTAFMDVPPHVLRAGRNVIEIAASPRLAVYQDSNARFESLQFRALRLVHLGRS